MAIRLIIGLGMLLGLCVPGAAQTASWRGNGPGSQSPALVALPSPMLDPAALLDGRGAKAASPGQRSIGRVSRAVRTRAVEKRARPTGKALLLSAVVPGTGQIASGYQRGYVYLGVEAAAWISLFVLREDGIRKLEESEDYAGDPFDPNAPWSFKRYGEQGFCSAPGGAAADSTLRELWATDRERFYDYIETDPSLACGWEDDEARRRFRGMRTMGNERLRWARYAGAAVIFNHVVSVLDMVRVSRSFDVTVPGGANLKVTVKPSLPAPSGAIRLKKVFW